MQARRGVLGLVAAVSLVAVLLAPAGGVRGQGTNVLDVGAQDQMKTLNILTPLAWEDSFTMTVLARVYDTPVQRDPNASSGAIVPRLAVGIDENGNGMLDPSEVGRFAIPPGARDITVFYNFAPATFHDGVAVDIMDVLFSYHVLAMQAITSAPVRVLMGANYSTTHWLWVLPVDDHDNNPATAALHFTLQFTYLNFPWSTLGIPILPRHVWEGTGNPAGHHADFGIAVYPESDPRRGQGVSPSETMYTPFDIAAASSWMPSDADVVGSGHFRFNTWQFGQFARLDANLAYAFGRPKIDEIVFKIYRTTQLGVLALQSGDIDLYLWNLPPEFVPPLLNNPVIGLATSADLLPVAVEFNMRRQPFGYSMYPPPPGQDREPPGGVDIGYAFREAFAHLIDKQTIVRTLLQDYGTVADSMVVPLNTTWYNGSLPQYDYNPALAASIFDNQGWTVDPATGWRTFPRLGESQIRILTPQADFDPIRASAGAMIAAAARSIGVNAVSVPTAFGAIINDIDARDFDMVLLGGPDQHGYDPWTLSRGDPDYLLDLFHSTNAAAGLNYEGFYDAAFDAEAESARASPDVASRAVDVKYEQGILADRLPVIPLVYRTLIWAYRSDRFQGWVLVGTTLFNYWSLQGLEAVPPPPVPTPPTITLVSPPSGATIPRGTVIDLEIADSDAFTANYSVDGGAPAILPAPYDISTASWSIGEHTLLVAAQDVNASTTTRAYTFTVFEPPPLTDLGQVMTLVLAIVVIAVVAVVLAVLLLYRRWKRENRGATGPPPGAR